VSELEHICGRRGGNGTRPSLALTLARSLRIPTKYSGGKEYNEKIWDHAGGSLLVHESGGICTDMHGQPLNFGLGRTLKGNEGIVAAGREDHPKAVEAVRRAVASVQAKQ
jgi:3'(2'), 5'-bisphosphate nucleotidase